MSLRLQVFLISVMVALHGTPVKIHLDHIKLNEMEKMAKDP